MELHEVKDAERQRECKLFAQVSISRYTAFGKHTKMSFRMPKYKIVASVDCTCTTQRGMPANVAATSVKRIMENKSSANRGGF